MNTSRKGTRAERKLMELLKAQGFLVVRIAGSGNYSPDLIALKNGKALILEVKNSIKNRVYIRPQQYKVLEMFEKEGFRTYIALYRKGKFLFFPFSSIEKAGKYYYIDESLFHTTYLL